MEIFMKLREKIGQYDSSRPFQAWLYKVSANHCWDMLRRRRIRQDLETEGVEEMPLEHPDPSQLDRMLEERTSEDVRRALAKLPARSRMALVLRYYSEMSYGRNRGFDRRAAQLRRGCAAARAASAARSAGREGGGHGGGRNALNQL